MGENFRQVPEIIEGRQINLRIPRRADAETISDYLQEKKISRMTFVPYPYSIRDARSFIARSHASRRKGSDYVYGLAQKDTNRIIGMIGFHSVDWSSRRAEIGYWVGRKHRGQGLASEAVGLMLWLGFGLMKLNRIVAHTFHINPASDKILLRHKFVREGTLRRHMFRNNRWLDLHLYGLLAREYRAGKKKTGERRVGLLLDGG